MNPQGPIVTTISDSNRENNCDIYDSVIRTSHIFYRIWAWNGTTKNESENLRGKTNLENTERKNNFEIEKVGRKKSIN